MAAAERGHDPAVILAGPIGSYRLWISTGSM